MQLYRWIAFSVLLVSTGASAQLRLLDDYQQTYVQGRAAHQLAIDNDSLLLDRRDGFYSSGLRYTHTRRLADAQSTRSAGWRIGHEMYTPSNINIPAEFVGPPEHPYAAWLYAGVFQSEHRADGSHYRLGVDIGCLGPCAGGEWMQNRFHRLLRQPLAQGWARQVRSEVGVLLYGELAPWRWQLAPSIDLTPVLAARFGNIHTDATATLILRAGRLNQRPGEATLHGFVRTELRAVGYNATLQGGYFSSGNPHTVAPKRLVRELELGLAWAYGYYDLRLGLVQRGNEIRDLPNARGEQSFVRLQLVYTP